MGDIVFIGLSARGNGGIQGFNRRVIAALGAQATVLMLDDFPGLRRGAFAWRVARSRGDTLLVGHVNLLPIALLWRLGHPRGRVILFAHGIEVWGDPAYRVVRWWEPTLLRRVVDRVAVVSRYSRDRMMAAFGLREGLFAHFPNAVDVGPLPERAGGETILAVTRLGAGEREKHVDKLVRALPLMPGARLVVVGDGPLRAELRGLAAGLGVTDRVDLLGAVDRARLDRAYREAAVFALPSSKEGFGIVYLEAWANGLPVVGSCFGAAGEVIADGVDGFTVEPADVPALAAALDALIRDPARAAAMGRAGHAKVVALYSGAAFVANLRALLDRRTRR